MGLLDALNDAMIGIVCLVVLAAFIAGVWSTLISPAVLGNTQVHPMGFVTLGIISLITLVYAVGILSRMLKATAETREKARNIREQFRFGGEEE